MKIGGLATGSIEHLLVDIDSLDGDAASREFARDAPGPTAGVEDARWRKTHNEICLAMNVLAGRGQSFIARVVLIAYDISRPKPAILRFRHGFGESPIPDVSVAHARVPLVIWDLPT